MWKWIRKDETRPESAGVGSRRPTGTTHGVSLRPQEPAQKIQTVQPVDDLHPDVTHIGHSIAIKGEISGSGDVYLDGELEGSIELPDGNLTVGPNGHIRASLRARHIVVQGRAYGNLHGIERVELKKSAALEGDILTQRVAIEDGAQLKGAVQVQKGPSGSQTEKGDKKRLANESELR